MKLVLSFFLCFIVVISYSNASELSRELSNAKADYAAGKFDSAFEKFSDLAAELNSEAMFYLGQMYSHGKGVEENSKAAMSWYEMSANGGFVKSQTELATMLYFDDRHQESIGWFKFASENGDPIATGYLGSFYLTGEFDKYGLKQDFELAAKLLEEAAKKGDVNSYAPLVFLNVLLNFDDIDFDFLTNIEKLNFVITEDVWLSEEAKPLLEFLSGVFAGKDGDPVQKLTVARVYKQGLNLKLEYYDPAVDITIIRKNVSKSLYWAKLAAQDGNEAATEMVSELLISDLISGNQIKGFENLKQAIEVECDMDFACSFDKIWKYLDISNDGNLSLAEISRFQRGLINLAYAENSKEIKIEELTAANLGAILLLPIASRAIINNYDYNNDEVLQKYEIFGDTEFAKLVGIDTQSLMNGVDFGKLGDRLNEQMNKIPFGLFK